MLVTFGDSVIQTFICFKVTNINTYQETLILSHIEAQLDCIGGLDKVSKYRRLIGAVLQINPFEKKTDWIIFKLNPFIKEAGGQPSIGHQGKKDKSGQDPSF